MIKVIVYFITLHCFYSDDSSKLQYNSLILQIQPVAGHSMNEVARKLTTHVQPFTDTISKPPLNLQVFQVEVHFDALFWSEWTLDSLDDTRSVFVISKDKG